MTNKNQLQLKTKSIYIIAIVVGISLSLFVFLGMKTIANTTNELINQQIPALMALKNIDIQLSEQERLLYEYYASINSHFLDKKLEITQKKLQKDFTALFSKNDTLINNFELIQKFTERLKFNLSSDDIDWDLARLQLASISEHRRIILPELDTLIGKVNFNVKSEYSNILEQLDITSFSIIAFSFGLFLAVLFMGRYTKRYVELSATNERLAYFPNRNPNPVMSLTRDLHISYQNPATSALLSSLQLDKNPLSLLSTTIQAQLNKAEENNASFERFEHQIGDSFLRYDINWLKDVDAFDIHIQDITKQKQSERALITKMYCHEGSKLQNKLKFQDDLQILETESIEFSLILFEVSHYSRFVGNYGLNDATEFVLSAANIISSKFNQITKNFTSDANLYHVADASFAIVLQNTTDSSQFKQLLNTLQTMFEKSFNTPLGYMQIQLQFGITEFPNMSQSINDLMLHAQVALDDGIKTGNSVARIFDQQLGEQHVRKQYLNSRLEHAITQNELQLYFQPQVSVLDKKIVGAETLIRWKIGDEFISPAEFIPLAEQSGFILTLGQWILEQACEKLSQWNIADDSDFCLAVNISPRQFMEPNFTSKVKLLIDKYNLNPASLELEITEGIVMENEVSGLVVLNKLKEIGVSLSIDDFGTGYSSLSYLKQFPVDKLKIDQSFIRNIVSEKTDQAIVLTLCQLARNLNLSVIAEGVEEVEQLAFLEKYECDIIQGYFYSKPLPEQDFLLFLAKGINAIGISPINFVNKNFVNK